VLILGWALSSPLQFWAGLRARLSDHLGLGFELAVVLIPGWALSSPWISIWAGLRARRWVMAVPGARRWPGFARDDRLVAKAS
jgi:hypothetical protein